MKLFLKNFVLLLLFLLSSKPLWVEANTIIDPNLEESIKFSLDLDTKTTIKKEQLTELDIVDASWWGVRDISGIEFAKNLRSLYLEGNELEDISLLSNLSQVRHLKLTDN